MALWAGFFGVFGQVAEIFTGTPGAFVDLETTINDFEEVASELVAVDLNLEMKWIYVNRLLDPQNDSVFLSRVAYAGLTPNWYAYYADIYNFIATVYNFNMWVKQ